MREIWQRLKWYVLGAAAVFVGGVVLGGLIPLLAPGKPTEQILQVLNLKFKPILEQMAAANIWDRIGIIFLNNLKAAMLLFGLSASIILLPISTLALLGNGVFLGLLGVHYQLTGRMALGRYLLVLAPHGILELPAVIMAGGLGVYVGITFWGQFLGRRSGKTSAHLWPDTVKAGALICLLLLLAAVIEVTVSPLFLPAKGA